jgi:hypothetical protein
LCNTTTTNNNKPTLTNILHFSKKHHTHNAHKGREEKRKREKVRKTVKENNLLQN